MARRVKIVLQAAAVSVVALLIALLGWQLVRTDEGQELGSKVEAGGKPFAPVFTLERLDTKQEVSLASLRGKVVVLNFWASWCLPCKDEASVLQKAWQTWRDRDVVVVGVDVRDFDVDARRFVERYGLTYPIVRDRHDWTWGRYGLRGVPETWFVDRRGRLVGERIEGPVTGERLARNIGLALRSVS
jgi:cytochrome c biogenesis protein CcmG, thiol:disulfide interchange protein DsbE